MQDKLRNFYDAFGERIAFLREKRGVTLGALSDGAASTAKSWEEGSLPRSDQWEAIARRLGLSVSFVFLGKPTIREDYDFVAKYADEIGEPPLAPEVHEEQAPYNAAGISDQPTEQQCIDYFMQYLGRARQIAGGLGHTWVELHKHFSVEQLSGVTDPKTRESWSEQLDEAELEAARLAKLRREEAARNRGGNKKTGS